MLNTSRSTSIFFEPRMNFVNLMLSLSVYHILLLIHSNFEYPVRAYLLGCTAMLMLTGLLFVIIYITHSGKISYTTEEKFWENVALYVNLPFQIIMIGLNHGLLPGDIFTPLAIILGFLIMASYNAMAFSRYSPDPLNQP